MITDLESYNGIKARYIARSANGQDRRELELIRFSEMQPQLAVRPLVKGFIEQEQLSLIRGESGCGKTFFALDLGLHIAAARDWFGRRVAGGAVVYVAAEAGRGIINRIAAFKRARGYADDAVIPFVAITSVIDLCHASAGDVTLLISTIQGANLGQLALVVIDTVSRALAGGNENAPDDMGAFVGSLDRLRDELRCHVAGVHHVGKDLSKGGRGHSLLHCAVDTEIEIVRDEATRIATATIVKQRDGPTDGAVAFRLRQIELGNNLDGDLVTSCIVEPDDQFAVKPNKRSTPLSPQQSTALQQLTNAMNIAGQQPPSSPHIPPNTHCVDEAIWRDYCYKAGLSAGEKKGQEKAFNRAVTALQQANRIGRWGMQVWVVPQ